MSDINEMELLSYVPEDYDPQADIRENIPAPPPEGRALARLFLRQREDADAVYVKVKDSVPRLIAAHAVRYVNEDGTLGGYLKDYYSTSVVGNTQSTSSMAFIAKQAGKPFTSGMNLAQMKEHYEGIFQAAGEDGVDVEVQIQWLKLLPSLDENGLQRVNEEGRGEWIEIKGRKRIEQNLYATVEPADLAKALEQPWVYSDPLTGETRTVKAEIVRLLA